MHKEFHISSNLLYQECTKHTEVDRGDVQERVVLKEAKWTILQILTRWTISKSYLQNKCGKLGMTDIHTKTYRISVRFLYL